MELEERLLQPKIMCKFKRESSRMTSLMATEDQLNSSMMDTHHSIQAGGIMVTNKDGVNMSSKMVLLMKHSSSGMSHTYTQVILVLLKVPVITPQSQEK